MLVAASPTPKLTFCPAANFHTRVRPDQMVALLCQRSSKLVIDHFFWLTSSHRFHRSTFSNVTVINF